MKEANLPDQETIDWMNEELTRFRPEDQRTVADEIARHRAANKETHQSVVTVSTVRQCQKPMKQQILLAGLTLSMASVSRAEVDCCGGGEDDFDYHTKRNPDLQCVPYSRKSKREVYRKR